MERLQPTIVESITRLIYEDIECSGAHTGRFGRAKYAGFNIIVDKSTGYVNATKLCDDNDKKFNKLTVNKQYIALVVALTEREILKTGIRVFNCETTIKGTHNISREITGRYVHKNLIPFITAWISQEFHILMNELMNNLIVTEQLVSKNQHIVQLTDKIDTLLNSHEKLREESDKKQLQLREESDKKYNQLREDNATALQLAHARELAAVQRHEETKIQFTSLRQHVTHTGDHAISQIQQCVKQHIPYTHDTKKQHQLVVMYNCDTNIIRVLLLRRQQQSVDREIKKYSAVGYTVVDKFNSPNSITLVNIFMEQTKLLGTISCVQKKEGNSVRLKYCKTIDDFIDELQAAELLTRSLPESITDSLLELQNYTAEM